MRFKLSAKIFMSLYRSFDYSTIFNWRGFDLKLKQVLENF